MIDYAEPMLRPRAEWVFMCPEAQLGGWDMPKEAKQIWKVKVPGLDLDIVTLEGCNKSGFPDGFFRRQRDGKHTADVYSHFPF